MAVFKTQEARFRDANEQFPILHTDGKLEIYKNPSGEIFIEDRKSGVTIRLNADPHGGLQFTTDGRVEPERVSNMIGWRIDSRR